MLKTQILKKIEKFSENINYACSTHTTLGFSAAMNKVMRLSSGMKLETVIQSFMVDLDYDTKNSSVAGQSLDMILRLVAPEYAHKPWSRHKQYLIYIKERGMSGHLFAFKDNMGASLRLQQLLCSILTQSAASWMIFLISPTGSPSW